MSTLVLSATVESPCMAIAISLPSGATDTSPSPLVAMVGASWSTGVRSLALPSVTDTRNSCCRLPARQSSQWRHNSSVQMRASVGYSPLRRSISCSAGHLMSLVTRTPEPSGSHTGSDTPSGRPVSRRASPPATGRSHSCGPLSRVETKARVRPSGDQRGWRSDPGPAVSWRDVPVATSASQMRAVPRFSLREGLVTIYATSFPSGLSCGSPTTGRPMYSSIVRTRCWAAAGLGTRDGGRVSAMIGKINSRRMSLVLSRSNYPSPRLPVQPLVVRVGKNRLYQIIEQLRLRRHRPARIGMHVPGAQLVQRRGLLVGEVQNIAVGRSAGAVEHLLEHVGQVARTTHGIVLRPADGEIHDGSATPLLWRGARQIFPRPPCSRKEGR